MNVTATSPCNNTAHGWPVTVYRHTKDRGWQRAAPQRVWASPCMGGVEIRQFRVRIRVFQDARSSTAARCTKRRNLLYLSTRSQTGSIVLKFLSVTAVNEFFDELLDLNGRKIGSKVGSTDDETITRNDQVQAVIDTTIQRRERDTLSYLARLLYDNDFQNFVKHVEKTLMSTDDGIKMLAAFQVGDETESHL